MKKLNKKLLVIGLAVLFFTASLIFLVKAQVPELAPNFYRVNSASTTRAGAERAGDKALIKIINRSDKDYFVPNKTRQEFDSFNANPPRYVSTAICGDKVCSEGENTDYPNAAIKTSPLCGSGVQGCGYFYQNIGATPLQKNANRIRCCMQSRIAAMSW